MPDDAVVDPGADARARMNAALPRGKKLNSRVFFAGLSRINDDTGEPVVLWGEEGVVKTVITDATSQSDVRVRVRFPFYVNPSVTKRYIVCSLAEVRCTAAPPLSAHPLALLYLGTTRQPCTPALPLRILPKHTQSQLSRVALRS